MTHALRAARMVSQLLDALPSTASGPDLSCPDVVEWFGGMQAQDLASVMWSLGLRTGASRADVTAAIESGTVLRTWPMRGTLHLVPAVDARWMVEHLGRRALAGAERRRQALGLSARDADRAADILGDALAGGRRLTRAECVGVLEAAGIPVSGQLAYHLLWYASQRGVTCVGPNRGREQTFVLLDEWVPASRRLDRPAALATIAERFFRSHGPATVNDLARWADLTAADARAGIAEAPGLARITVAGTDMLATERSLDPLRPGRPRPTLPAFALPGFDELVLGYRDRSAQLAPEHEPLVVPGGNGVFYPTLVVDGRVVGTWRRRVLSRTVQIHVAPFGTLPTRVRDDLEDALTAYATFLGLAPDVRWVESGDARVPPRG